MKLNNAPVRWHPPACPVLNGLRQKNCLSTIVWTPWAIHGKPDIMKKAKEKK